MVRQTIPPQKWVIVDDGSTDDTFEISRKASSEHSWITVIRRPDRGFRKSGGGVVEAFYDGYAAVSEEPWEFIVKLDGDLTFEPGYFEACFAQFANDARLGIGGGTILVRDNGRLRVDSPDDPPFHVRGATKIYRRACWEQISPLVARTRLGHDRRGDSEHARLEHQNVLRRYPGSTARDRLVRWRMAQLVQKRACELHHRIPPAFHARQVCEASIPEASVVSSSLVRGFLFWISEAFTEGSRRQCRSVSCAGNSCCDSC